MRRTKTRPYNFGGITVHHWREWSGWFAVDKSETIDPVLMYSKQDALIKDSGGIKSIIVAEPLRLDTEKDIGNLMRLIDKHRPTDVIVTSSADLDDRWESCELSQRIEQILERYEIYVQCVDVFGMPKRQHR
jgi:hypothetical protein